MAGKKKSVPAKTPVSRQQPAAKKSANQLRSEIRDLTLQIIQERKLTLADLSRLGEEVLDQATTSLRQALPASRQHAFRQLVDGLADAWAATAAASGEAVQHARENGVRLAKRDLNQLSQNLRSLEGEFMSTLQKYSKRLEGEARREFQSLISIARKTGTAIRPAVQSAGQAVWESPLETVGGLASSGIKVGADAVGGMLLGASGVLEGLGKSIRSGRPPQATGQAPPRKKMPAKKSPAKKIPVKTTASRPAPNSSRKKSNKKSK